MDRKYLLARNLRKNTTPQEYKLWQLLRNKQFNGIKFIRQYPIGSYIADFCCRKLKIVIEIDGGQHNNTNDIEYDNKRTKYLSEKGYKVIRFWNNEIDDNIDGIYEKLLEIIVSKPSPKD